jgi:hypothetical protein
MNNANGKVDLHLHSHASNVTGYYAADAFANVLLKKDTAQGRSCQLAYSSQRRGASLAKLRMGKSYLSVFTYLCQVRYIFLTKRGNWGLSPFTPFPTADPT